MFHVKHEPREANSEAEKSLVFVGMYWVLM